MSATVVDIGDKRPRRPSSAVPPRAPRPKPAVQVTNFRRVVKGALRGFVTVRWNAAGIVFTDCAVYAAADGRAWCSLPAAPVIDSAGRHHIVNGRKQFREMVRWRDRDRSDRFSERVISLLLKRHPDALASEASQ